MADIYKRFAPEDMIPGDLQTVSSTVWSGEVNPLTTFFTSSNSSSWEYYVPVYNKNPITDNSAAVQFAVAFGNRVGSGSLGDTTVVDNSYGTPSKAVYSQFKNLLLPPTDNVFTLKNSSGVSENADSIYVVTVNRSRFKQKLDPGNWEIRLGTGASQRRFIDGSGAGENASVNEAGRVFGIYSGSGGVTASATQYGLFYPDLGIMVFTGSVPGVTTAPSLANAAVSNSIKFVRAISESAYFAARTEERVTSNHYFVRVTNQQFNFSNNPTFTTGSFGQFRWSAMLRNPQVYITTIGLYDDFNRLLAVAKLSRPLLKTFNREALIKVKIDY